MREYITDLKSEEIGNFHVGEKTREIFFFFLIYLFIYLFIFGCVGSSFLCEGFL